MKRVIEIVGAILFIIGVVGAVVSGEAYLLIWGLFFPVGIVGGMAIRYADDIVEFLEDVRP